jgi:hypothetical protein
MLGWGAISGLRLIEREYLGDWVLGAWCLAGWLAGAARESTDFDF